MAYTQVAHVTWTHGTSSVQSRTTPDLQQHIAVVFLSA